MGTVLGNNERESWWLTNNTGSVITIGDLPMVPSIGGHRRIDLLSYAIKDTISRSKILPKLLKSRTLTLNKRKTFPSSLSGIIRPSTADRAVTLAEEDEAITILYGVSNDNSVVRTNISNNTLEETDVTICDNGCLHNVNSVNFNITPIAETHTTGKIHWNEEDGTLEIDLLGDKVKLQVGQENVVLVRNESGSDIANGKVVYINGAQGNSSRSTIDLADNTDADKIHVLGLTTEAIADGQLGYVATQGAVRGVNTESWTAGDKLYLSTNGDLANVQPGSATEAVVLVGRAVNSKLDGTIEITQLQAFTSGNNFNGTLRQSIINKNTGDSAAAGFTSVNDNNHFATFGIACSGNTGFPGEVSVMYGPGYGDHWQAVDGNKDFVWFTDPEDLHANNSLNYERMRLEANGDLYVKAGDVHITNESPDDPSNPGGNLYLANNLILENVPTSDPGVAGAVWSDSGTLKISSG